MKRVLIILGRIANKIYWTFAVLVVLFAVLATLARALTPILKHYQPNITAVASQYLHNPIKIRAIKASWRGFQPVLDLSNVDIYDKDTKHVVFGVNNFEVGVNLWQSLLAHKIIVARLYLDGMQLVLTQDKQAQWQVKGFDLKTAEEKANGFSIQTVVSWLLLQPQLVLQNISLRLEPNNRPTHQFDDIDLELTNAGNVHQLRGQANLSQHRSPVDIAVDLFGKPSDVTHLTGHYYLQGKKIPLSEWFAGRKLWGFACEQGDFNFQLWGDWQQDHSQNLQASLNVANVKLQANANGAPLLIDQLSTKLQLTGLGDTQQNLLAQDIDLTVNHHNWPTDNLQLTRSIIAGQKTSWQAQLDYAALSDLQPLLGQADFIPASLRDKFNVLAIGGKLQNLNLRVVTTPQKTHYHATAQVKAFNMHAWHMLPGLSQVNASLNVDDQAGELLMNSPQSSLSMPKLFSQNIALENLQTQVQWQQQPLGTRVRVTQLTANLPNGNVNAAMSLWLSHKAGQSRIALLSQYGFSNLQEMNRYFPVKVMQPNLVKWLTKAIIAGQSATGKMIIFGKLKDIPYTNYQGQFIIDNQLTNVQMHFAPKWPDLTQLSGDLRFTQDNMLLTSTSGEYFNQPLESLTASIPSFNQKPYVALHIDAHLHLTNLQHTMLLLTKASPLKDSVGKKIAPLDPHGQARLHLQLTIPFAHKATQVVGDVGFDAVNLKLPLWRLNFTKLNGNLHFTNTSLGSHLLSANLFNRPVKIKLSTQELNKQRYTQVSLTNRFDLRDVKHYFQLQNLNFINGTAQAVSTINIAANGNTHLVIKSNMQGVSLDLPKPFFKAANQPHPFQVDAYLNPDKPPLIRFTYDDLAGAILAFDKKNNKVEFSRAKIHLGDGGYILQKQPGVYLSGNLSSFSWVNWQDFYNTYLKQKQRKGASPAGSSIVKQIDVNIQQLQGLQQNLTAAHLLLVLQAKSWLLNIDSDRIQGRLTIPFDYQKQAISGEFNYLHWYAKKSINKVKNELKPSELVPLALTANDFSYNKTEFGKVSLALQAITHGINIKRLTINNPQYNLTTTGQWLATKQGEMTNLSGQIDTSDLGDLLSAQGVTKHIKNTKGDAQFNLSWPGNPGQFQSNQLQGTVKLNLNSGAITGLGGSAEQKLGLAKLINVLSIQSIFSKLTLNFDDSQGFAYNTLTGDLTLTNGSVYTQNLYLDGPAAEIFVKGEVGLVKKIYDINLQISPYVTSSLPVIAAIAGGPLVGVATWAVSKLARSGIEKVVAYHYHIGGSWQKPVLTDLAKKS